MSGDDEIVAKRATSIKNWPVNDVAWSGSRYVAVGSGGMIVSSADGLSWNVENSPTTNSLYGVTWSGSRFIAVGVESTALVSPDGISWTSVVGGPTATEELSPGAVLDPAFVRSRSG
jgi:hypothetical protein